MESRPYLVPQQLCICRLCDRRSKGGRYRQIRRKSRWETSTYQRWYLLPPYATGPFNVILGNDFAGRPEKDGQINGSSNPLTGLTKTAQKILAQQKNPACSTLFVGNLGFETKEEEIAALFGRLHPKLAKLSIKDATSQEEERLLGVRMGTFEDSGKCKGLVALFHR